MCPVSEHTHRMVTEWLDVCIDSLTLPLPLLPSAVMITTDDDDDGNGKGKRDGGCPWTLHVTYCIMRVHKEPYLR